MLLFPWNTKLNFPCTSCTIFNNFQLFLICHNLLLGTLPWHSHYLNFFPINFNSITSSNLS
jgi:hypothetical protein